MSRNVWNPVQYERFRDERSQPFFDLMALVRPQAEMHVVDLGCGTGELTRELHRHLGAEETVGIDNAPGMLAKSNTFVEPGLRFERRQMIETLIERQLIFNCSRMVPPDSRLPASGESSRDIPKRHACR